MYSEKITYTGYDGEEHTDRFYFNLNEAELTELSYSKKGGYGAWLQRIISEHDTTKLVPLVRNLILSSYGKKSDDGITFEKSTAISDKFYHSDAYNKLFMKLFTDKDAFNKFCTGIIPATLVEQSAPEAEKVTKQLIADMTPDDDTAA